MRKDTISILEDAAAWHCKCAENARTKKEQALHMNEAPIAITYGERQRKHLQYADAIRAAVKSLKTKEAKKSVFEKPSFCDVCAFTNEACPGWPQVDVLRWYDHFESVGWVIGANKKMKDWKAAARNGYRNWKDKNPTMTKTAKQPTEDPENWRTFLSFAGYPYGIFSIAEPFKKDEFRIWIKENK